jgi:hypothetical protein
MSSNILMTLTIIFALLALIFFILTIRSGKKRKIIVTFRNFIISLLMLSLSALLGTIIVSTNGYNSFTKEELAATVIITPISKQKFNAQFTMPDGSQQTFTLSGDQLYVDAHILKWKPLANIIGLHTSYELDRVSGRYAELNDERSKTHTHYSLSQNKMIDMFNIRQKFAFLSPLLDAEYGSASFINSNSALKFKIMVSTSGLLIRKSKS